MSFLALGPELIAGAEDVIGIGSRAVRGSEEVLSTAGTVAREGAAMAETGPAPRIGLDIDIKGAEKAERDLAHITLRLEDLSPVMRKQIRVLEEREATMFGGGKYVDTGALRNSLTMSGAPGAVREVKAHSLRFGTSIWYAKYQVRNPGPQTASGGLARKGHESAVMRKLTEMDARRIADESGDYFMHGRI